MSTITKQQFLGELRQGVDVDSTQLSEGLSADQLTAVQNLDKNHDGRLTGNELKKAYDFIESYDHNRKANSFVNEGEAGKVYAALQSAKLPEPNRGAEVASAALNRITRDKTGYGYDNAPTSPNPNLSGNAEPGVSRPSWLKGQNKCNQFVGDALYEAGMAMPEFRMKDGSTHYMNAERLPFQEDYFRRLTDVSQLQPGDVVVIDYTGSTGANTAHTEVVTDVSGGKIATSGAHANEASTNTDWKQLEGATYDARGERWQKPGVDIYLLRPIQER